MLPQDAEAAIREYLADVTRHSQEAKRAERFVFLLAALFKGLNGLATEWSEGREKTVRILDHGEERVRHLDAYYRNAVIEFEASERTFEEGRAQLKEQTAGLWREWKCRRPIRCAVTDGVVWHVYHPSVMIADERPATPADIDLIEVESLDLRRAQPQDFYFWLDRLLLRESRVAPTTDAISRDFGARSPAFLDAMTALRSAWNAAGREPEAQVGISEWRQYLTFVYGSDTASDDLFLRHTYLAVFARLLVGATLGRNSGQKDASERLDRILDDRAFEELGFANLGEAGFFGWISRKPSEPILRPTWLRLLAQLSTFDLHAIDEDILKGVYQDLVDPETRHELGEYYTPDWLADRILRELLPGESDALPHILDPACGSGTFLRLGLEALEKRLSGRRPAERLEILTSHVFGFDIHPLAVQIARATYALALRDLVKHHKRPVELPVYLADSLFLPRPLEQLNLLAGGKSIELEFAGDRVRDVPAAVLDDPSMFNPLVAAADELAEELSRGCRDTEDAFLASLRRRFPDAAARHGYGFPAIARAFFRVAERFAKLRKERRDSVWAFVLRNMYRPALLRGKFDLMVGNPPWLSYRYVTDPAYQKRIGGLADHYKLAASGKLRTQLELAAVFLLWGTESYLRDGGRVGFVMPRSLFNADQHDALRRGTYEGDCRIDALWDLRGVHPLFNVPSCVVFGARTQRQKGRAALPLRVLEGTLPARNATPEQAGQITESGKTAYLNFLAERSCWHDKRLLTQPHAPSPYLKRFRQGATIVPRNFYFVRPEREEFEPDDELYIETDREQAKDAKPPYRDEFLSGRVEARFLYRAILSKHVLPFVCAESSCSVLPIEPDGNGYRVLDGSALRKAGFRAMAKWMDDADQRWRHHRGGKAQQQSLLDRLDFQHELSHQDPAARHLVLYNKSGTHVAACVVSPKHPLIVDHTAYWATATSSVEGAYLCGLLNADIVNAIVKPFQSLGLLGERDIHTKVLSLPLPAYDANTPLHRAIAELADRMAERATNIAEKLPDDQSIGRARSAIRAALATERENLDKLVRKLLQSDSSGG